MNDRIKDNYFVFARLAILLALVAYSVMSHMEMNDVKTTGVSIRVLLLVSFFIGFMAVKELFSIPVRRYLAAAGMLVWALLISLEGKAFWVLGFFCGLEFLSLFPKLDYKWYFALLIGVFVETPATLPLRLVIILMLAILYVQHNYVVVDYRRRMKEDVLTEQSLKRDMREREVATKAELARSALIAENQILEERAALSQT